MPLAVDFHIVFWYTPRTYIFEKGLELLVLVLLDEHMFVVDILNDDVVVVLVVDPADDGLDGRITLHQNSCR